MFGTVTEGYKHCLSVISVSSYYKHSSLYNTFIHPSSYAYPWLGRDGSKFSRAQQLFLSLASPWGY